MPKAYCVGIGTTYRAGIYSSCLSLVTHFAGAAFVRQVDALPVAAVPMLSHEVAAQDSKVDLELLASTFVQAQAPLL